MIIIKLRFEFHFLFHVTSSLLEHEFPVYLGRNCEAIKELFHQSLLELLHIRKIVSRYALLWRHLVNNMTLLALLQICKT